MRLGSGDGAVCSRLASGLPSSAGLGVGGGWGAEAPLSYGCHGAEGPIPKAGWDPPEPFLGENWNQPCPTSCTNQL